MIAIAHTVHAFNTKQAALPSSFIPTLALSGWQQRVSVCGN